MDDEHERSPEQESYAGITNSAANPLPYDHSHIIYRCQ